MTDFLTTVVTPPPLITELQQPEQIQTNLVAGQGPAGVGASPAVMVAGENLAAGDYVYINASGHAMKADNRYESRSCMGWVNSAALNTEPVTVQFAGINGHGLALVPGPVWLGINGGLTQTPPTTGALVQLLGYATSATNVNFVPGLVVVLAGTQP